MWVRSCAWSRLVSSPAEPGPNFWSRVGAALYRLAMATLLSPSVSDVAFDGQVSPDGSFISVCGLTLTSAFVTPAERDVKRGRKADCAAQASDRVGYGFQVVLLLAPGEVKAATSPRLRAVAPSPHALLLPRRVSGGLASVTLVGCRALRSQHLGGVASAYTPELPRRPDAYDRDGEQDQHEAAPSQEVVHAQPFLHIDG